MLDPISLLPSSLVADRKSLYDSIIYNQLLLLSPASNLYTLANKYFELKTSWGCRHNSNYLLIHIIHKSGRNIMSKQ